MQKRNKIVLCAALFMLLCIFTCLLWIEFQPAAVPFYLEVKSEGGIERYACWRGENQQYYVFIPCYTDLSEAQIVMNTSATIFVDGEQLDENTDCSKFQEDYVYELIYCSFFNKQKYELIFMQSGNMPVVHIDTESGKMDYVHGQKGNEEKANIRIYSEEGTLACNANLKSIAARGNSTFGEDKKPYIIHFLEPENLFDMGSANKWILLANAFDLTNLRNYLVFEFAQKMGIAYTPDIQWIELYLNGEYAGLYLLTEKIEVNDNRVELPNKEGYLLSFEDRNRLITQNLPFCDTKAGLAVRIRYPETLEENQKETIASIIQRAENAILSENGIDSESGMAWNDLIDMDSWARKYLFEEIFANVDAGKWSQYFYVTGDEQKLYAGPIWDYDLSMAISWKSAMTNIWYCNRTTADGAKIAPWLDALSRKPEFMRRVVEIYKDEFCPILQELMDIGLDQATESVARSSIVNAVRWNKTAVPEGNVELIREYLQARVQFLNDIWLEGTEYVKITAYLGSEDGFVYLMMPAGSSMDTLPPLQGNDFQGWYWSANGMPIEPNQNVVSDAQIYAMRREGPRQNGRVLKLDGRVPKLIPLGVIALIGCAIVTVEIFRLKSKRWHDHGRNG